MIRVIFIPLLHFNIQYLLLIYNHLFKHAITPTSVHHVFVWEESVPSERPKYIECKIKSQIEQIEK